MESVTDCVNQLRFMISSSVLVTPLPHGRSGSVTPHTDGVI